MEGLLFFRVYPSDAFRFILIPDGNPSSNMNSANTDEDPGLWIESFAVINLRGVSTNKILHILSPCKPTKNLLIVILFF
jgi:hypothetical protein